MRQGMDVIPDTTNFNETSAFRSDNSSDVLVQSLPDILGDRRSSVLRPEDDVICEASVAANRVALDLCRRFMNS